MVEWREVWREYGGPVLIGGLWGLATLDQFFLNVWLNFEPGWLIKTITFPGYIAHQIPFYKSHMETIVGILEILTPAIIGGFIGVLIHRINKEVAK